MAVYAEALAFPTVSLWKYRQPHWQELETPWKTAIEVKGAILSMTRMVSRQRVASGILRRTDTKNIAIITTTMFKMTLCK